MIVQAETAARGAEHKFLHTLRSSPGSGWTMSDETEQCRARAKGTEIMNDTIQHHRSDCNNATTFY